MLVVVVGAVFALLEPAWVAYVALALALGLRRPSPLRSPAAYGLTLAVLLGVMLTHVVFFGAGRYALVTFPLLCAVAALGAARRKGRATGRPHPRRVAPTRVGSPVGSPLGRANADRLSYHEGQAIGGRHGGAGSPHAGDTVDP